MFSLYQLTPQQHGSYAREQILIKPVLFSWEQLFMQLNPCDIAVWLVDKKNNPCQLGFKGELWEMEARREQKQAFLQMALAQVCVSTHVHEI